MNRLATIRRPLLFSLLLIAATLIVTLYAYPAAANLQANAARHARAQVFQPQTLRERIQAHQLASTVQVLASQPPSVIIQFPLFPSGVKKAFPQATGVVTIIQGNPAVRLFDSVTVDVSHMPPDTTFTIFFIELANTSLRPVKTTA